MLLRHHRSQIGFTRCIAEKDLILTALLADITTIKDTNLINSPNIALLATDISWTVLIISCTFISLAIG